MPSSHVLISCELDTGHFILNVDSQPLYKASNLLELRLNENLYEVGELNEVELVLLNDHVVLNKVLELLKLLHSNVCWY